MATDSVVLVHGMYHGSWVWDRVAAILRDQGMRVHTVDLPGRGRAPGEDDFTGHVRRLREVVAALPEPSLLCCHSYGGAVTTEAIDGDLPVTRLVYLAALAPEKGETVLQSARPADRAEVAAPDYTRDGERMRPSPEYAMEAFFNDISTEDRQIAEPKLIGESPGISTTPLTRTAWRTIPSSYVLCARDRALAVSVQRAAAARTQVRYELDSGHSPMLGRPADVAAILRAESFRC